MNAPLESDLLRTFIAVAETSNFTKAAEMVGRTQSAVSMQIKKLEDAVGSALFDRGSRGVSLTKQGNTLLLKARRVILLLDETAASMRQPSLSGVVRIGIPEEYGSSVLPKALRNFDQLHPGVEIIVNFGRSSVLIDAMHGGKLDLAVVYEQGDYTTSEILRTDPTVWVTSDIHETHLRSPLPVAMYSGVGWARTRALALLDDLGRGYRIAYVSDTSNGLMAAVQAGLGIAPLARAGIPPQCRELTLADGFAVVDHSNVTLRVNNRKGDDAITGMASAIREAFQSM
ncbi:MAG: LysR family transcriptional regulator [Rhizobium sp.]|nr:LysR family transcriptional regulator [Rhizobium sp.]